MNLLIVILVKRGDETKVSRIYHLVIMNVCTKVIIAINT